MRSRRTPHAAPAARLALTLVAAVLAATALAGCGSTPGSTAGGSSSTGAPAATSPAATTPSPSSSASASGSSTTASSKSTSTAKEPDATRQGGTAPKTVAPLLAPIAKLPKPQPAKQLRGPSTVGVPVLMYHEIANPPAGAAHPDLYVAPAEFAEQMTYLIKHGYHAVTLQQVWDFWHGDATLPSKPVVISFDDGDTPDFTIAAPLLNEIHWPGTLNLIVGKKQLRLKPEIVRALIAAGWEIDSHTVGHTDLPGLPASQLRFELTQSRARLHKLYGVPVNFFCYPSGRFDDAAVAAVEAAGYLGATTTRYGLARPSSPYLMRRVRVSGGTSGAGLGALIQDAP